MDALEISTFSIYLQDYGAPIGLRLASRHPERVQALIVQNGNAYMDGFTAMWEPLFAYANDRNSETEAPVRGLLAPETIKWLWSTGRTTRATSHRRPGRSTSTTSTATTTATSNSTSSTTTGSTSRSTNASTTTSERHQPPMLITWGANDEIFGPAGAEAYKRDLPDAELHLLDTGHFALEEELEFIAHAMRRFLKEHISSAPSDLM